MARPRLIGTHHHYQTSIINEADPAGPGGISGLIRYFENNRGASVEMGDVVVLDPAGNSLINVTTTPSDADVIGVVAGAGPYADGEQTPVLIAGYHGQIKVTGTVNRGDYLSSSSSAGVAAAGAAPGVGTFARVVNDDVAGLAAGIVFDRTLAAQNFIDLLDVPSSYSGEGEKLVAVRADELGLEFVEDLLQGTDVYDPRMDPPSPSATNDEFDDNSLDAAWTQQNGGSATRAVSETDRKGFVHITNTDGGAGSDTGIYRSYVPGATAFTLCARVFGTVRAAGSNQCNLQIFDGSGNFIYGVGMLGNSSQFIVNDSGGFRSYNVTYISPNIGEVWLMLRRDTGTGYEAYVSGDGHIWTRLEGASRSGTVGRIKIVNVSFSSTTCEAYWDFVRVFAATTLDVGGIGQGSATLTAHTHASSIQGGLIRLSADVLTTQGDLLTRDATQTKRLARSVPAANVLNVLGLANGDVEPAWKTVLDATNPANVTLSATPGTSLVFAHRDHGHALDVAIAPTWTGKHIFGGSRTLSGQLDAIVNINGAVTTSVAVQALLAINGTMSVGHDVPVALLVRPFLTFTANVNEAYGGSLAAFINPNAGVTVALAAGFRGVLASSAGTGTITRAAAIRADNFVVAGGPTPVNNIGVDIQLMNAGTNNYQMGIGEVDTTAEGTYYGRFSVLYNGLKKYVSVRNA